MTILSTSTFGGPSHPARRDVKDFRLHMACGADRQSPQAREQYLNGSFDNCLSGREKMLCDGNWKHLDVVIYNQRINRLNSRYQDIGLYLWRMEKQGPQ
jgi:hypothetical protein